MIIKISNGVTQMVSLINSATMNWTPVFGQLCVSLSYSLYQRNFSEVASIMSMAPKDSISAVLFNIINAVAFYANHAELTLPT